MPNNFFQDATQGALAQTSTNTCLPAESVDISSSLYQFTCIAMIASVSISLLSLLYVKYKEHQGNQEVQARGFKLSQKLNSKFSNKEDSSVIILGTSPR